MNWDIWQLFAVAGGLVALIELAEYIFTKNIPWLAKLLRNGYRRLRWHLGWSKLPPGEQYLVLNFSGHPVSETQRTAMQQQLGWPQLTVIEARLGNVPESRRFVGEVRSYIGQIDLPPEEWQRRHLAVIPAGYAPAWSVLLAELHGRLGYFPDMVRLRPTRGPGEEKFEVVEVVSLRDIRNEARSRR